MTENPSTEVAVPQERHAAIATTQSEFTPEQQAILKAVGCAANTKAEWALFLAVCQRTQLDPFARQIYMVSYGGAPTIQTSIDGYRVIAKRSAAEQGIKYSRTAPQWCGPDGKWTDIWLAEEPPAAARVGISLDGGPVVYATCLYREYVGRTKAGTVNAMWQQRPAGQLAKCAEALAYRQNFPNDMAGVYITEELDSRRPASVVTQVVDQPKTARYYMTRLHLNGRDLRAFAGRVIGDAPASWESISHEQQQAVLDRLGDWEALGFDPTTTQPDDVETIDLETGEILEPSKPEPAQVGLTPEPSKPETVNVERPVQK